MQTHTDLLIRRLDRPVDLLAIHRTSPEDFPFLLESSTSGTAQSRYSLLLGLPGGRLVLDGQGLRLNGAPLGGRFTDALDALWREECCERDPGRHDLPFTGGWFLYLGYELAAEIEPVLALPPAPAGMPTALAVRCRAAIVNDREEGCAWLVAEGGAAAEMERMVALAHDAGTAAKVGGCRVIAITEDDPQRFLDGVERIRDYIRDGDVFQVNLSRAWRARLADGCDDAALYERLCTTNPAPFAGLARIEGCSIISSSPERLVSVHGGEVSTRPIAGTRPRSPDADTDAGLSRELIGHPKECAEHIMLIDLERNDLGRVCVPGSVHVDELMTVESYAHVHHIVSNIRGRLSEGTTPGEVIRAVFPGGTITGCPKVRCMEIIAELEGVGRGAYTGSMGWLDRSGDMDLNILIRTLVRSGDSLQLRAGAGIVADSDPARELEETRHKAAGLLRALGY